MKYGTTMAMGVVMLSLPACGAEPSGQSDPEEVHSTAEEIRGGTLTLHNGVVEVLRGPPGCTGVLIGPQYLLTAAHCVKGMLGGSQFGAIHTTIQRYDEEWGQQLATGWNERLWAWMHPDYTGGKDKDDDIAIVHRIAQPWSNTTTDDYLRISQGTCTQIDRMMFYGRGYDGFSGEGEGRLREMPINLHGCFSKSFYDLEGDRSVCMGDSGGPYIVDVAGTELVAGVLALMEVTSGGSQNCAKGGGEQWGARINGSKMDWIQSYAGPCSSFSKGGHTYRRCW